MYCRDRECYKNVVVMGRGERYKSPRAEMCKIQNRNVDAPGRGISVA